MIVLGPEPIDEDLTPTRRAALRELHLRRIDLADEVRVVSEGGYVGSATRREIEYARERRKAITSVEPSLDLDDTVSRARNRHPRPCSVATDH
ncbi:hypothetical protein [Microlunatus endophyticus]|uniref:hypothetical protein n=1 Tax=Microlunatus endophyticus TaxID=1716077 RepID=UPI001E334175|nr:hypothetical protein [Microlunatus endophyticus]